MSPYLHSVVPFLARLPKACTSQGLGPSCRTSPDAGLGTRMVICPLNSLLPNFSLCKDIGSLLDRQSSDGITVQEVWPTLEYCRLGREGTPYYMTYHFSGIP